MKAVAKMFKMEAGELKPVSGGFFKDVTSAAVEDGETVVVQLWHGPCLESEIRIGKIGDTCIVSLIEKKELRKDPPKEVVCGS